MPVSHDDLIELAAELDAASMEQAAERCPRWSALSLKAATTLREIVEPSRQGRGRQGRGLRATSYWGRFRRWLWWLLNWERSR